MTKSEATVCADQQSDVTVHRQVSDSMNCARLRTLWCGVLIPLLAHSAWAQTGPSQAGKSLVQLRVNTAYDDSPTSLKIVAAMAKNLPSKKARLRPHETLSDLIVHEYAFGPRNLPKTYRLIEDAIRERNPIRMRDLRRIPPGTYRIPSVPSRAWKDFKRNKVLNYLPKVFVFARPLEEVVRPDLIRGAAGLVYEPPTTLEENRRGAQTVLIDMPMSPEMGRALLSDPEIGRIGAFFNRPMTVHLADLSDCDSNDDSIIHKVLTGTQPADIASLLAQALPQRQAGLFILDTGYPSDSAYRESLEELSAILTRIWSEIFGKQPPYPFTSDIQPGTYIKAGHAHCRCIERGLHEFVTLDPQKKIKVIYVPLTQEQGAVPLLRALVQTSYLLQWMGAHQVPPDPELLDRSLKEAQKVTDNLPSSWQGEEVKTDKAIVDAILWIGKTYATLTGTAYLVNESWTVDHDEYLVNYDSPLNGIVVAAAGNASNSVNDLQLVDFAQRCIVNKDTLAILNLDSNGPACGSSWVDEHHLADAFAVGYDGKVSANVCGTSFASPRVAWLLAAAEVARTTPVDLQYWGLETHKRLVSLRNPSASPPWLTLRVDPVSVVKLWQ